MQVFNTVPLKVVKGLKIGTKEADTTWINNTLGGISKD